LAFLWFIYFFITFNFQSKSVHNRLIQLMS
jgi:hypothetical protein